RFIATLMGAWTELQGIALGRLFFSSRRRHTRSKRDWSSDVCSFRSVFIGNHGTPTIPTTTTNDMHPGDIERVGGSHHGADIEIVLPIFDGNLERVAPGIQVSDDGLDRPVPVVVGDVATIAFGQQGVSPLLTGRPFTFPRADPDFTVLPTGFVLCCGHCLSLSTRAAPAAAAVDTSTDGQEPIFLASGCDAPKAPR